MRNYLIKTVLCLAVLSLLAGSAFAQRTSKDQFHLSGTVDYNLSSVGGEVLFGQYLLFGYWSAGANLQNYGYNISDYEGLANFQRLTAEGTFMYRFVSNRSRSLSLYGGGDVFVGAEMLDMFSSLPNGIRTSMTNEGFKDARFIFGGGLRLEGEYFPFPRLAIILPLLVVFTANTAMNSYKGGDVVGFNIGVGVRYNF